MPSASIACGIEGRTKSVESRQLLLVLASPPSERCTGLHDHGRRLFPKQATHLCLVSQMVFFLVKVKRNKSREHRQLLGGCCPALRPEHCFRGHGLGGRMVNEIGDNLPHQPTWSPALNPPHLFPTILILI